MNLLSNALKFTLKGVISVKFDMADVESLSPIQKKKIDLGSTVVLK